MKDNELRELLGNIERKIEAAHQSIVGGDAKENLARIQACVERIQELAEAGRRFESTKPLPLVLSSPGVPAVVGMSVGAIIFLAGMFVAWLLK
jgi:hypothetical protein